MAAGYTVVSQDRTVQVLSQTEVADVERVGFVTKPTGIYAERLVPYASWLALGAAGWIEPLAQAIENLISGGLASFATFVQDIDPSGLLADFLDFLVVYQPSGGIGLPQTTTVRIPVNTLTLDTSFGGVIASLDPAQTLRDAYDALVATANL